tara:strand:+ start:136 stop:591 length:456 start_codon:yes stop_codon:yes gene_type:complete
LNNFNNLTIGTEAALNTEQLIKSNRRNLVAEIGPMSEKNSENGLLPMLYKGACLVLVGLLTLLGIAGLILPIIPGILFLFLAALLLAKVSSRFDALLHKNESMRTWWRRWDTSNALPLLQRVKLSFLLVARAVVNGIETTVNSLNKAKADS